MDDLGYIDLIADEVDREDRGLPIAIPVRSEIAFTQRGIDFAFGEWIVMPEYLKQLEAAYLLKQLDELDASIFAAAANKAKKPKKPPVKVYGPPKSPNVNPWTLK